MTKKFFTIIFTIISLSMLNAAERHVGLCLAGGGSVAVYQVGVWKYLSEQNIVKNIKAVSATSVSAWNGALFATKKPAEIQHIWSTMPDDIVLSVDIGYSGMLSNATSEFAETMGQIYEANKSNVNDKSQMLIKTTKEVTAIGAREISSFIKDSFWKFIGTQDKVEGLYERNDFYNLLKKEISLKEIQKSPFTVYISAVCKEKLAVKAVSKLLSADTTQQFVLSDQPTDDYIHSIIMAASATPFAFTTETLDENVMIYKNGSSEKANKKYEYIDGAFEIVGGKTYNLKPLLDDKEIYEIIVVYLQSLNEMGRTKLKTQDINKKVVEIIPSVDLSAFVNKNAKLTKAKIDQLIQLGYTDAKAVYEKNKN